MDPVVRPGCCVRSTALTLRVVLEEGGMLSHAAVVARECNLPCVVQVKDVVASLSDGQTVIVDGESGTVSVVEPEAH